MNFLGAVSVWSESLLTNRPQTSEIRIVSYLLSTGPQAWRARTGNNGGLGQKSPAVAGIAAYRVATGRNNHLRPMPPCGRGCHCKPLIWLDRRGPCRVPNSGRALRGEHGYSRKWDGRESVSASRYSWSSPRGAPRDTCVAGTPLRGPIFQRRWLWVPAFAGTTARNITQQCYLFSSAARTRATVSAGVRDTCSISAATCSPESGSTSILSLSASAR